ncbi:MAG: hypothetical protein FD126_2198 [Elusimicrobia bacterium]|nr:MAG: hypothetical protein FD126_2198 [Elusimicrobiota bacterium]
MKARRPWALPAAFCYVTLAAFTWTFEGHAAQGGFREFRKPGQGAAPQGPAPRAGGAPRVPFCSVKRTHEGYSLHYGFKNFNGRAADVSALLDTETVAQAIQEHGFKESDFKALDLWYKKAQEDAIAEAEGKYVKGEVKAKSREELEAKLKWINDINKKAQADLEKTLASLSAEYRRKRLETYTKGGFRMKDGKSIEADIPTLAKRNWKRVRPLAKAFSELSESEEYETDELVGAVVAMTQTSLRYEVPDTKEGSRVIGGAMPPPQTLVLGQGDCDTKTAVISAILLNWPNLKLIGLAIPGHYLMAYHRAPRRGEVFVEHEGLPYVMIESAGPAWLPPGVVGDQTQAYLDSGQDFRIQPINL